MPTSRRRHTITETDDVAAALDVAARCWPSDQESRSTLLLRLVQQGRKAIEAQEAGERERRAQAVEAARAVFAGMYPPGYLEDLRRDWPD